MTVIDDSTLVNVVALTLLPDFIDIYGAYGPRGDTYNPPFVGHRGWMLYGDASLLEDTDLKVCFDNTPYDIDLALDLAAAPVAAQMEMSLTPEDELPEIE